MLYKSYEIKIWKTEWVGKIIHGVNYSLNGYSFCGEEDVVKNHKYAALVWQINPSHSTGIYGGSTPLIALDLARFAIDLQESNRQRFDIMERLRIYDQKCLRQRSEKRLSAT
jgi:hypothetical protein